MPIDGGSLVNPMPAAGTAGAHSQLLLTGPQNPDPRTAALERSRVFLQSTLDALALHVTVLAPDGAILRVNRAWRQFGNENDLQDGSGSVGANYLAACDRAAATDDVARQAAEGIRAVIVGTQDAYYQEYPCHSPTEHRWFALRVTPFEEPLPRRVTVTHENITRRLQAQAEAEEANRFLGEVIEAIPTPIRVTDAADQAVAVNTAFTRTFGPDPPPDLVSPGGTTPHFRPEMAPIQRELPQEEMTLLPSGERRWLLTRRSRLTLLDGKPGMVATVSDITDLRESSSRLQLQSSVLAMIASDAPLATTLDELCRLLATSYDTATAAVLRRGPGPNEFTPVAGPPLPAAAVAEVRLVPESPPGQPGTPPGAPACAALLAPPATWPQAVRAADGQVIAYFVLHHATPLLPDEHDRALLKTAGHLVALAIERDAAQRVLHRQHAELEAMFAAAPDALFLLDLAAERVVRGNARLATMLDLPPESLIEMPLAALGPPPTIARLREAWAALRRGEAAPLLELPLGGANRPPILVDLSCQLLPWEGREMALCFLRDASARVAEAARRQELERQFQQAMRLSSAAAMASGLAHELNQPLTAAANFLQLADWLLPSAAPEADRLRDAVAAAVAQTRRAGEILRRLRDFIGRGDALHREEDLATLLRDTEKLLEISGLTAEPRLELDLPPGLGSLAVDRVQIQQVLVNLVRNALEAMREMPRQRLVLAAHRRATEVEISVADTGPGIAPQVAARLFQPFVSSKTTGMGMGLSICRAIIDAHGGSIAALPYPGGGTIFRIILPIQPDHLPETEALDE